MTKAVRLIDLQQQIYMSSHPRTTNTSSLVGVAMCTCQTLFCHLVVHSSGHACDDVKIVNCHNFRNSRSAPLAVLTQLSPWEELQITGKGETACRRKYRQRYTLAVKQIELIAIAKAFQYAEVTFNIARSNAFNARPDSPLGWPIWVKISKN